MKARLTSKWYKVMSSVIIKMSVYASDPSFHLVTSLRPAQAMTVSSEFDATQMPTYGRNACAWQNLWKKQVSRFHALSERQQRRTWPVEKERVSEAFDAESDRTHMMRLFPRCQTSENKADEEDEGDEEPDEGIDYDEEKSASVESSAERAYCRY